MQSKKKPKKPTNCESKKKSRSKNLSLPTSINRNLVICGFHMHNEVPESWILHFYEEFWHSIKVKFRLQMSSNSLYKTPTLNNYDQSHCLRNVKVNCVLSDWSAKYENFKTDWREENVFAIHKMLHYKWWQENRSRWQRNQKTLQHLSHSHRNGMLCNLFRTQNQTA